MTTQSMLGITVNNDTAAMPTPVEACPCPLWCNTATLVTGSNNCFAPADFDCEGLWTGEVFVKLQ